MIAPCCNEIIVNNQYDKHVIYIKQEGKRWGLNWYKSQNTKLKRVLWYNGWAWVAGKAGKKEGAYDSGTATLDDQTGSLMSRDFMPRCPGCGCRTSFLNLAIPDCIRIDSIRVLSSSAYGMPFTQYAVCTDI